MSVKSILDEKGYDVSSISANETLAEAADFLAGNRIGAVIVSRPDSEIAGILSERDIVNAISLDGKEALDSRVSKYMTADVKTCHSGNRVLEVMKIMSVGGFRHLPIVDDGRLMGIISMRDVIKYRMEEVQREAEDIKAYIAAS